MRRGRPIPTLPIYFSRFQRVFHCLFATLSKLAEYNHPRREVAFRQAGEEENAR